MSDGGEVAIEIFWIILLVLSWILSNAAKKKTSPPGGQPWDQSRRRQPVPPIIEPDREIKRPRSPFPNLQDLGKEIREVLLEVDDELEPTILTERKKVYRVKPVPESDHKETFYQEPIVSQKVPLGSPVSIVCTDQGRKKTLSLSESAVVHGFIMSEILQPPRSKRPLRQ